MFLSKQDSDFCAQTQVRAFTAPQNHVCYGPSVKGAGSENGDSLYSPGFWLPVIRRATWNPSLAELPFGHDGAPCEGLDRIRFREDLEPQADRNRPTLYLVYCGYAWCEKTRKKR